MKLNAVIAGAILAFAATSVATPVPNPVAVADPKSTMKPWGAVAGRVSGYGPSPEEVSTDEDLDKRDPSPVAEPEPKSTMKPWGAVAGRISGYGP